MNEEWEVQGYYYGSWEMVTTEATKKEAMARLREYEANEPGTAFRIKGRGPRRARTGWKSTDR
jgi:ribulose bisphosphate carboxylase small subunit